MSIKTSNILSSFTKRWQFMLALEVLLYAIGFLFLAYFISSNLILACSIFIVIALVSAFILRPWKPNQKLASSYIDHSLKTAEYSSGLLLIPSEKLSTVARLQQQKVALQLSKEINTIKPPHHLKRTGIITLILILLGFMIFQFNVMVLFTNSPTIPETEIINFYAEDSSSVKVSPPKLVQQEVTIAYPKYTNVSTYTSSSMNINAVEGTRLFWKLVFDKPVASVTIDYMSDQYEMNEKKEGYVGTMAIRGSGFYYFRFQDTQGATYSSDLYAIEMSKDQRPNIEITDIDQMTSFEHYQSKILHFNTAISDDFGVADAYIIATVSKGSGESVKFREEHIRFGSQVKKGQKTQQLSKTIDLDQLQMEPGDELYFYVQASDLKQPEPNYARSETFFAVIRDTTINTFGVEGTLGVDRMPDYFRSQRQLIIDTEKLIKEKPTLTEKEFKFRSNELGFDQKALRLKYGEFMGIEDETAGGIVNQESLESLEQEQEAEQSDDDPLEEYTHDHDGDNEHNLVDEHDHNNDDGEAEEDPLEAYTHDHEDPEMTTLFEESLRSKLLRAMTEMWDAELYLRLYKPELSLPYQYRALKLIQEIKNSARIYVHRIGFDPPPIKEDKRLTGDLEKVNNFRKTSAVEKPLSYPSMRIAIKRLEELIQLQNVFSEEDKLVFEKAGNELAILAIEAPGKYLKTLQQLKRLTDNNANSEQILVEVQKGLLMALPQPEPNSTQSDILIDDINKLVIKELQLND